MRFIEWATLPVYIITCLLLLGAPRSAAARATPRARRAGSTIAGHRLGQPAELAKVTVMLMLARVLGARREAPRSLLELWKPAVVVGIPLLLIMLQADLGTAIVFVGIFFAMLFWAGVPLAAARAHREPAS